MTTINHWGKWIDSNVPTTGVLSIHDVAFEWVDDEICLTCEDAIDYIESNCMCLCEVCLKGKCEECENCQDLKQNELEYIECDSSHTRLLGDWVKDNDGLYGPDEQNGEFSAIENESTIQVVWSKFTTKQCKPCSPCYPGQLDVDYDYENGDFIAYTLPDYLLRKENE